jgi:hypothetical protein
MGARSMIGRPSRKALAGPGSVCEWIQAWVKIRDRAMELVLGILPLMYMNK